MTESGVLDSYGSICSRRLETYDLRLYLVQRLLDSLPQTWKQSFGLIYRSLLKKAITSVLKGLT